MIGCDPDALDRLASNLRIGSRQIDGIFDELSRTFASLEWTGCDSENFVRIWQNRGQAGFDGCREHLARLGDVVSANAEDQRSASLALVSVPSAHEHRLSPAFMGKPRTPGSDTLGRIAETRRGMEEDLDRRRKHLEMLKHQLEAADGGFEERVKDALWFIDSDREKIQRQIDSESKKVQQLESLLKPGADGDTRQFLKVDLGGDGRIIEVLGDLENAEHIAIHVPGMDTDIGDYVDGTPEDPLALYDEMRIQANGEKVAVISFLDYNPPDNSLTGWFGGAGEHEATKGAQALDSLVDTLHSDGFSSEQLSVVAHSYGSTTTGIALEHFDLQVSRVAVVGSPGLGDGVDDVSDLHRPDVSVFAGKSEGIPFKGGDGDAITWLPVHGEDPADEGFGATIFETSGEGHSEYFDGTSLENLALIAVGKSPSSAE